MGLYVGDVNWECSKLLFVSLGPPINGATTDETPSTALTSDVYVGRKRNGTVFEIISIAPAPPRIAIARTRALYSFVMRRMAVVNGVVQ